MKIAVDAMGGDLAPKAVVEGALLAARDFAITVILVGDRTTLEQELADHDHAKLPITIEHAAETVAMDESPLEAVLSKRESSIHVGLELLKRGGADAFVSAGNSGAVMAAAMAILGNLPGVDRPAIASAMPTTAGLCLLIDAGANTDVKPLNLMQFGVMGSVYWKHVAKIAAPRVAILANGEEASKGSDLTRSAAAGLASMAPYLNYIGYVEGRDINAAKADVIVTDGFTGNVALKTMEGFATFLLGNLREVFESGILRKLAFLLIRKQLSALRTKLDPSEYGGAPLLGVAGRVIIAHGSSSAHAIRNALRAAANDVLVHNVNTEMVELIARLPAAGTIKPGSNNKGIRSLFLKMRDRLHLPHPHRENPNANDPKPVGAADSAKPETPKSETLPPPVRPGELRAEAKAPEAKLVAGPREPVVAPNALPSAGENGAVREPARKVEPAADATDLEPPLVKTPPG